MEKNNLFGIYKEIEERSKKLIEDGAKRIRQLASAKNFVASKEFTSWTYGKDLPSATQLRLNGASARLWLERQGFTNVLEISDHKFRNKVEKYFLNWASQIVYFNVIEKYYSQQKSSLRFELLIHRSLLPDNVKYEGIPDTNQKKFDEGYKKTITKEILYTVRNAPIIKQAKKIHGNKCTVCKFDFSLEYGRHGDGFIEMHHLDPIKNGPRKTTVQDLRPVCANCHRMLHKGRELISIKELQNIIRAQKRKFSLNNTQE